MHQKHRKKTTRTSIKNRGKQIQEWYTLTTATAAATQLRWTNRARSSTDPTQNPTFRRNTAGSNAGTHGKGLEPGNRPRETAYKTGGSEPKNLQNFTKQSTAQLLQAAGTSEGFDSGGFWCESNEIRVYGTRS